MSLRNRITVNNISKKSTGYINKPETFDAEIIDQLDTIYFLCVDEKGDLIIVYEAISTKENVYFVSFYNDMNMPWPSN